MNENDLKRYTVILGGGSGVLFQPLDETKTYILSAKHVFYKKETNDGGPDIDILMSSINYCFSDKQSDSVPVQIKKGENYFEHSDENVDAAILILNENLSFNQIFADIRRTSFSEFNLTGYPNSKRNTDDKYDKLIISDLNSYDDSLVALRLVVNHLEHEQITGFSGGGIMKINGDSLLLAGIQSKTPIGPCNGEIQVVPIKRFEEIIQQNDLPQLLPNFFSKIDLLLGSILEFNQTTPGLQPKLQGALRRQAKQIKCDLKDIYNRKVLNKSAIKTSSLRSKQFWISFLEYAIIISLIDDVEFNEEILSSMSKKRKFIFSDSSKNIYDMYSEILMFAAEDIDDQCQVLVGTTIPPTTNKTRRMSTAKVPQNISSIDDEETIDRIAFRSKIKEIIHIKAIELDCINENDAVLDQFSIDQFDQILTEIKRLVNEFFNN